MQSLFGIPTPVIAAVLAGLTATAAVVTLLLAARNPVLVKLGIRHIPRRRARSVLIVIGLALSTTIVAAAFTTGDALGYTLRALVSGSLGNVDAVVVSYGQGMRRFDRSDFEGLADGRIPTVTGDDFTASAADEVRSLLAEQDGVAGVIGATLRQYAIANSAQQVASGGINLLALPSDTPPAFGTLATPDGAPLSLAGLGEGDVILNTAAAGALLAQPGDELLIYRGSQPVAARVAAVAANGDLGGTQATAFVSLPWWQSVEGRPGRINQVLIVNQGGVDSLRYSEGVANRLRSAFVNDAAARQIFSLLATPAVRDGLRRSLPTQPDSVRPRMAQLLHALEQPGMPEDFKPLMGDILVLGRLRFVLSDLAPGTARQFASALMSLNRLTVVEIKRLSLDLASNFATALTATFLVLGLFSIATGIMLVFLIFTLLAAERRGELGMARALGTQRSHLVQIFLFEGALYDLLASLVGVLAGIGVALLTLDLLGGYLTDFGIRISRHIEPYSLVIALCLGLLLTYLTVIVAAWRIARLNVVAAVRNLPDEGPPPPSLKRLARQGRPLDLLRGLLSRGPLLVILGLGLALVTRSTPLLVGLTSLGWSLAMIGVGLALRWLLRATGVRPVLADRIGFTVSGLALLLFWVRPIRGTPLAETQPFVSGLEVLTLAGLLMVLGAVWVITYNLELLPALVGRATTFLRGGAPLAAGLRIAAAYPARYRWRTGLAILMFALVIFTVTTASILLAGTRYAYADLGVQAAGFDLRADIDPQRLPNLAAALAAAPGVSADAFAAVGGQASIAVEAIEPGAAAARWQSSNVQVVDDGWLAGMGADLTQRAPGYADDRAVWDALRATPGLAVLHGSALAGGAGQRGVADPFGSSQFAFQASRRDDRSVPPTVVWVRDPKGGPPLKLTVIGVLDNRVSLGTGLYTTPATLQAGGWTPPPPRSYYFRIAGGETPRQAALGLSRSFSSQGLTASVLNEELRAAQGIRLLLNQLLQGFMGLGLVSGVVALGVLATRAVVERRQQIGVLRALGFQRGLVQATFLAEASLIAGLGILVGVGLGIVVSRNVVHFIAAQNPEIQFGIPWGQISLIVLVAYGMTLLTTIIPAWQAGRVYPAEALRYE